MTPASPPAWLLPWLTLAVLIGGGASALAGLTRALLPEIDRSERLRAAARYLPHVLGALLAYAIPEATPAPDRAQAALYAPLATLLWGPVYDWLKSRVRALEAPPKDGEKK